MFVVGEKASDDWGVRIEALAIEKLCVRCEIIAGVGVSGTRLIVEDGLVLESHQGGINK